MCNKNPVYQIDVIDSNGNQKTYHFCERHAMTVSILINLGIFYGEMRPMDRRDSEVLSCDEKIAE